jgi:DNA-binding NarL/FixJ family response regulator
VRARWRSRLPPARNLPGGSSDRTLVPAVRALALGQAVFAPRAAVPLLNPAQWDETSGDIRLSLNRWQREVLRLIAEGHSDQEIEELWQPDQLSAGAREVHRWRREVLRRFTQTVEKLSPYQVSESAREAQRLSEAMSDRAIAERLHLSQSTLTELRQEIAEWSRARWEPVILDLEVLDEVRQPGWAQSTVAG